MFFYRLARKGHVAFQQNRMPTTRSSRNTEKNTDPLLKYLRDGTGKQQVERKKLTLPPNPQPACSATRQTGHMAVHLIHGIGRLQ
jgi:hypothetical protein